MRTTRRHRSLAVAVLGIGLAAFPGGAGAQEMSKTGAKEAAAPVVRPAPLRGSIASDEAKQREWTLKIAKGLEDLARGKRAEAAAVFEALEKADPRNPIALGVLVRLRVEEGRWAEARELLGPSSRRRAAKERPPVPLSGWHVVGPFRFDDRKSFDAVLEPEKGEKGPRGVDLKASFPGDGRICRWQRTKAAAIDFREALDVSGPGVAYAAAELVAENAGWVRLGVASADAVKLWLNGELVLSRFVRRRIQEDADIVHVCVRRGANTLVAKVDSRGDEFRLYVQVYDQILPPAADFLDAALAGRKALRAGQFADAESRFREAEALEPGNAEVALGLAEAALRRGNSIAARGWVGRALLARASSSDALRIDGEIHLALFQPIKAFDSLRAAYRESGYRDQRALDLWREAAKGQRSELQEGLALLDQARGLRAEKRQPDAEKLLETARPLLEKTFVGLADLGAYRREEGDIKGAAGFGLLAIERLDAQQIALHCSSEWILNLVKDLRETQPANEAARLRLLSIVESVDPSRADLIRELVRLGSKTLVDGASAAKVEALLRQRPEKDLYKAYVERLFEAKEHRKVVEIARQGIEAGVVSRKLLLWLGHSHLALGELDDAEEAFRKLGGEAEYLERANDGLAKVEKARMAKKD